MSSYTCLNSLHFGFCAILVFSCCLLPAVLGQPTSLGRGGRCFDYLQRCVRDSTCAYTLLLQTDSDDCDGLEETVVKMSEINKATQTQLERVEALERTVAEQANRLEILTAENQRITAETDQMRAELSDLKTKCSLCQNDATDLEIEDPKFIFNGSSTVTFHKTNGTAHTLSEYTFCVWMRTRDDVIYDEFTALVHYQADESPSTSRYFSHGMTFSIGHIRQYRAGELYTQGRFRNLISPLDDGLWHHVCHAWVGRIGTGRTWIYVDGTGVILGDLHYEHMAGGGTVYLGRATHSLDVHKPFIGEMTEFYMFDVKLDEQVIAWMVQNCSGNDVAGALIHWPTIIRENRYMAVNIIKEVTDVCGRPGCRLESCMVGGACLENQSQGINGETCICANLENTCPADQTSSKYVLGSTSRVSLSNAGVTRNLSAFTFCLWTKTVTTGNSVTTIFEFEASGSSDASNIKSVYIDHSYLLVTKYDDEQHQVSSRIGSGPGRVNDGSWHLLCVTGTLSDEASFHIYRDGIQITRSLYRQELQLHAMGTVRLGFSPMKPDHYAFRGDVYGFHMWPVDLSENWHQLYDMFRLCGRYITEGAIIQWAKFQYGNIEFLGSSADAVEAADICMREN